MRVRKLTATGDYSFGNGQLDYYQDVPQGVGQLVQTSLLLFLGEWYLDTTVGTPWIEGVLGKHTQALADSTIQAQILLVQGVVSIASYQSTIDPNTRQYSATTTINTLYGTTEVQVSNYANF